MNYKELEELKKLTESLLEAIEDEEDEINLQIELSRST